MAWLQTFRQRIRGRAEDDGVKGLKKIAHALGTAYTRELCRREYANQSFSHVNERPVEYRFVMQCLSGSASVKILDVGTGTTALPHILRNCGYLVTAIDNVRDYWKSGNFTNRHYHVIDDNIVAPSLADRFDFITCVSVLEHIPDHNRAVDSMFSLLNPAGYIALTFPYNETNYIENVYMLPGASYGRDLPYVCQVYSRSEVDAWLARNRGKLVVQEFWRMFTGKYWTFGERLRTPIQVERNEPHQLTCLLLQKADGAPAAGIERRTS
jgi:SAM-dependent methyltransferase